MKRSFCTLFAAVGGLTALVFLAGCAGTDTRRSTADYFDDRALSLRVESALEQEDQVRDLDLNATTVDGVVQLSGSVENPEQRYRAEEIVEGVPGVTSVVNNIDIGSDAMLYGAREADDEAAEETETEAEEELEADAEVDPRMGTDFPNPEARDPQADESPARD